MHALHLEEQQRGREKKSNVLMGCCAEWMDSAAAAAAASALIVGAAGRCGQAPQRSEDYLMSVRDAARCRASSSCQLKCLDIAGEANPLRRPCFQT